MEGDLLLNKYKTFRKRECALHMHVLPFDVVLVRKQANINEVVILCLLPLEYWHLLTNFVAY